MAPPTVTESTPLLRDAGRRAVTVVNCREDADAAPHAGDGPTAKNALCDLVGPVLLLVLCAGVSLSLWIATNASPQERYVSQLCNLVFMQAGLIVMLDFYHHRASLTAEIADWRHMTREWEPNVAMLVFLGLSWMLDVKSVIAVWDCVDVLAICDLVIMRIFSVDVYYHSVRIFYLLAQFLFCLYFMRVTFRDTRRLRYGLAILAVAMIGIWFEVLLDESLERAHFPKANDMARCLAANLTNLTRNVTNYESCISQNTTYFEDLDKAMPICYPSMVEFALLAIENMLHWFKTCKVTTEKTERREEFSLHCPNMCDKFTPIKVWDALKNLSLRRCRWCFWHVFVTLLVSLGIMVWFILCIKWADTLAGLHWFLFNSIAYWLFILAVLGLGYWTSATSTLTSRSLSNLEWLILVFLIGPILYQVLSFVAGIHRWIIWGSGWADYSDNLAKEVHPAIYLAADALNTAQLVAQIPLLYRARSMVTEDGNHAGNGNNNSAVNDNDNPAVNDDDNQAINDNICCELIKRRVFIAILLLLTTSNLLLWVQDNFYVPGNHALTLHSLFFYDSVWPLVTSFINPLVILFRFHCAVLFFKAWQTLARQQFSKDCPPAAAANVVGARGGAAGMEMQVGGKAEADVGIHVEGGAAYA